jgi:hypothetical protein
MRLEQVVGRLIFKT